MRNMLRHQQRAEVAAALAASQIRVVILSENIHQLSTLRRLLPKERFLIHPVTDPNYLVSMVTRYRPEVIVSDLKFRQLGQDCWPILGAAQLVNALIQLVVIDNESESGQMVTDTRLITIPRALALQPGLLAQHVWRAGEQAAADRACCRRG